MRLDSDPRPLVDELIRIGRRLGVKGLLAVDDGNLSARLPDGTICITARGVRKDELRDEDFVRVDGRGRKIEGTAEPSSELPLHLWIYERRRDVGAVVHAHPPVATGFAVAGVPLPDDALAEAAARLGFVPVVPFAAPGTDAMGAGLDPFLADAQAMLLANHGAVALGSDPEDACRRMERLELVARTLLTARLLGGARPLPELKREDLGRTIQEEEK